MLLNLTDLSEKEVNLMLRALGSLPYVEVFELISKIQSQGNEQISASKLEREEKNG